MTPIEKQSVFEHNQVRLPDYKRDKVYYIRTQCPK